MLRSNVLDEHLHMAAVHAHIDVERLLAHKVLKEVAQSAHSRTFVEVLLPHEDKGKVAAQAFQGWGLGQVPRSTALPAA
jgi:hypothetical protein